MTETAATAAVPHNFGKLVFLDKEGQCAQEYHINKSTVVLGRCVFQSRSYSYQLRLPLEHLQIGHAVAVQLACAIDLL
jgi:hypothetical protein